MAKRLTKKQKARKKIRDRLLWTVSSLVFLGVFVLLVVWYALFRPLPLPRGGTVIDVQPGYSYTQVINQLGRKQQLHLPRLVNLYQRFTLKKPLQPGMYYIPYGSNARYLLHKLQSAQAERARIQLIEGWNYRQFKRALEKQPGIKKESIYLPDEQLAAVLHLPTSNPEGWLSPDTYFFPTGTPDLTVLKRLTQRQQRILSQEWETRAEGLPYKTPYEALIMASIIEKETNVEKERAKIAGVFINRLKTGMRLQTDPTVIYGMGERYKGDLKRVDLMTPTPYNTYRIYGLPPTPISMPGSASIRAALHPASTRAVYFVATGTGGHYFSETLAEHNQAVARYLEVLKAKNAPPEDPASGIDTSLVIPDASTLFQTTRPVLPAPAKKELVPHAEEPASLPEPVAVEEK